MSIGHICIHIFLKVKEKTSLYNVNPFKGLSAFDKGIRVQTKIISTLQYTKHKILFLHMNVHNYASVKLMGVVNRYFCQEIPLVE